MRSGQINWGSPKYSWNSEARWLCLITGTVSGLRALRGRGTGDTQPEALARAKQDVEAALTKERKARR